MSLLTLFACSEESPAPQTHELAVIELDGGGEVRFSGNEDGMVFVGELLPGAHPSLIATLSEREGATPLELWLALSGEDTPPEALIENHLRFHDQLGAPAEPRQLSLPAPEGPDALIVEQLYAATCTTDGTWFDDTWQDAGYTWHWYWNSTSGTYKWTASTTTSTFHSHLCNSSRGPDFTQHCIDASLPGTAECQDVPVGWRSVYVVLGESGTWRGLMTGHIGNTGRYKLGAMAP